MAEIRVCMASDFFYPNTGGVEEHIYSLSQCLMYKGVKVIILTHSYGNRIGIRYMTNGLKVYYLPIKTVYCQTILPTMVSSLPLIRYVLLREDITMVHGHAAFSTLTHETMAIAALLGIKTIFTDHSLFGFADASAIITNKFLELSLSNCYHCICVSHIGKENTVLRANVDSSKVSVIPNAVDTGFFKPNPGNRDNSMITIVVMSRLVYRKGIDLLADIMVGICKEYNDVRFIIGGDGPKRVLLEDTRSKHQLEKRIKLLGSLKHVEVRDVLTQGHIFLNTSLTEAYCMAIVEAAACGLHVVSTRVGGVPEVLPPTLMYLAEVSVEALTIGLKEAIENVKKGETLTPFQRHELIKTYYDWHDISDRTIFTYRMILKEPSASYKKQLQNYSSTGVPLFIFVVMFMIILLKLLDWFIPKSSIDIADRINTKHLKSDISNKPKPRKSK